MMTSVVNFFQRPGTRSSEFVVSILTVVWYIVNAAENYYSTSGAVKLSAPAIAYIISRGLAKYEQRNETKPAADGSP